MGDLNVLRTRRVGLILGVTGLTVIIFTGLFKYFIPEEAMNSQWLLQVDAWTTVYMVLAMLQIIICFTLLAVGLRIEDSMSEWGLKFALAGIVTCSVLLIGLMGMSIYFSGGSTRSPFTPLLLTFASVGLIVTGSTRIRITLILLTVIAFFLATSGQDVSFTGEYKSDADDYFVSFYILAVILSTVAGAVISWSGTWTVEHSPIPFDPESQYLVHHEFVTSERNHKAQQLRVVLHDKKKGKFCVVFSHLNAITISEAKSIVKHSRNISRPFQKFDILDEDSFNDLIK